LQEGADQAVDRRGLPMYATRKHLSRLTRQPKTLGNDVLGEKAFVVFPSNAAAKKGKKHHLVEASYQKGRMNLVSHRKLMKKGTPCGLLDRKVYGELVFRERIREADILLFKAVWDAGLGPEVRGKRI